MHAGGEDYVAALNVSVTLSSSTSYEGIIEVDDDGDFEGEINERFGVQLSLLSGDVPDRVTIETSTIEFQIEDNDPRPCVYTVKLEVCRDVPIKTAVI